MASAIVGEAIILGPVPATLWPFAVTVATSHASREAGAASFAVGPPPSSTAAVPLAQVSVREEVPPGKPLVAAGNQAHTHPREGTCPRPEPHYRCRTCRRNWHTSPWKSPSVVPSSAHTTAGRWAPS